MKEFRIYLDNELINVCCSELSLMCNIDTYLNLYGDRISVKEKDSNEDIEEKRAWLEKL